MREASSPLMVAAVATPSSLIAVISTQSAT
jgi:hypothetical protein